MKLGMLLLSLAALALPVLAVAPADTVATPEPATFVLLGTGLASVGLVAWRRSRKK